MKQTAVTFILVSALVGCAGSNPGDAIASPPEQAKARPYNEIIDALWEVIQEHKDVWLDEIELTEGKPLELMLKSWDPEAKITGAEHGIILKCHIGGLDVRGMTRFRRALREHPTLSRHLPLMNFDVSWNLTRREDGKESLDFDVVMVSRG